MLFFWQPNIQAKPNWLLQPRPRHTQLWQLNAHGGIAVKFEWDQEKAITNEKKHGISFSEALTIFSDPLELTISDPDHSLGEYRFLSIGQSNVSNLLVVSYTERYQNQIRIISARKATKHEQKHYERNH